MTEQKVLSGQVAVVSGAARGIGEAVSHRLAALGAHVVLLARDREKLCEVQAAIEQAGGSAGICLVDLRDVEQVEAFGRGLVEEHKRCDVLVNNAAVGRFGGPLHEMPVSSWDETMETNLRGAFLLMRVLAPLMIHQRSGHIVNISSLAGRNPLANGAAYAASKWALNGLTYSVAEELRPYGVRVSVVAPGSVNTGFGGTGFAHGYEQDAARAARKIQPEDVADVVELLVRQKPQSFVSEVLLRPTSKA